MRLIILIFLLCFFTSCLQLGKIVTSYSGYCRLLKDYSNYEMTNTKEQLTKSKFVYDDKNLELLKSTYELNKLTDNDDLITIKNLMQFVHNTIPYSYGFSGDKSRKISNPRNAINILKNSSDKNMVFVCRDMATVMTEVYLSVGLKARTITCMSYKYNDTDCHVVTEVYCEKLKKWIMVDVSFNAYILDKNNQILNLKEIRDKFANQQLLKTNSEIKINEKAYNSKEYLKYMSRVSFRFERSVDSEFGIEDKSVKRIILIPKNYNEKIYSSKNGFIITNNNEYFWN